MCGFISGLSRNFVPLIYISLFVPVPYGLVTVVLYYSLNSGSLISLASFFFLRFALAIWGILCFHTN